LRWPRAWPLVALSLLALGGCDGAGTAPQTTVSASAQPAATAAARPAPDRSAQVRDLSIDESMGGHTLARHVGKSDAELAERLRREPHISSASTYTDRATAERVVGATLAASSRQLDPWEHRSGRRPNLALYSDQRSTRSIGRSLSRGQRAAAPCDRAIVVLRWDERRDRFFVLTSYPEAHR
jgi:CDI toxin RNase A-like protein